MQLYFGDSFASQSSHENCGFCITRIKFKTIFKNFLVFPRIMCTLIVLSASPSPKTSIFTHKTSIFFINPSSIFKKRNGFHLFSMYFKFLALVFLDFVFMLRYGNMVVKYGFVDVLMSLIYGFVIFVSIMLILHVLMFVFNFCALYYVCVVLCIPC